MMVLFWCDCSTLVHNYLHFYSLSVLNKNKDTIKWLNGIRNPCFTHNSAINTVPDVAFNKQVSQKGGTLNDLQAKLKEITSSYEDQVTRAGACVALAPHRFRLKVKGSYKVLNCCLRRTQNETLGLGQYERQFVDRTIVGMLLCTEQRRSPWL